MNQENKELEKNPVEIMAEHIHVVIPIVGAVLIFLLAFIAVTIA